MAPKGDFENRDRDEGANLSGIPLAGGIGELPPDLAEERGDLDTYVTKSVGSQHPDMQRASASRVEEKRTGIGSPALDFTVRSTYDSRPTSARDFNLWFSCTPNEGVDLTELRGCFYVPQGFVAVIRKVQILLSPASSADTYDLQMALLVNGAIMEPERVTVGPPGTFGNPPVQLPGIPIRDPGEFDTFTIADENQLVGVLLNNIQVEDFGLNPLVGFHGNFLLKTGVPAMFQIANLGGKAKSAVTSSANDLRNVGPSGSSMVVSRRRKVAFPHVPILRK